MTTLTIFLLVLVAFMIGFSLGNLKGNREWNRIIDMYKETIEEYRKALQEVYKE
jgi:hypothetical protein